MAECTPCELASKLKCDAEKLKRDEDRMERDKARMERGAAKKKASALSIQSTRATLEIIDSMAVRRNGVLLKNKHLQDGMNKGPYTSVERNTPMLVPDGDTGAKNIPFTPVQAEHCPVHAEHCCVRDYDIGILAQHSYGNGRVRRLTVRVGNTTWQR